MMALSSPLATCAMVEERYDAFSTTVVATALLDQTAIDQHTDEIAQHAVDDVQRVKCMERHMDAWTALNEQRVCTILCQPSPIDALYGEIGASFNDLDAILVEHRRLVAVWSECGFLGRLAFFESVRMNRGNWDQNFAMRADGTETADMVAPDGLLLDMLERVLLGAQDAVETFKRTLHAVVAPSPKGGPIGVLMSMQDHWYNTLEDRKCTVAVEELANRLDAEEAEATAYLFLRWFGKAFGRWAAAIPSPSLALAYVVPGALATTPPSMQRYVDVLRGSGVSRTSRMFIRIERVRLWLKADTAEVKATGGRIKFGETYRPYVLHIFDNDAHGSVDLKRMMKRYAVLVQDDWDEFIGKVIEDHVTCGLATSDFQWRATPLLDLAGVELVAEVHARAAELYRAAPWAYCNQKLGVLVQGCSWRLGSPMGHQGKLNGGFAIEEYEGTSDRAPRGWRYAQIAALLYLREDEVPFADAEAAETHGFELAVDGFYPVPVYPDSNGTRPKTFSTTRPPKNDLEWMVRAIPAVIAFCEQHKHELSRGATAPSWALHKLSTTFTTTAGVLPACSVTVCYPPPAVDKLPDRGEFVEDVAVYMSKVGKRLRIYGLQGRPELNGTWGEATAYDAKKARFTIKLELTGESVLLKPANLEKS